VRLLSSRVAVGIGLISYPGYPALAAVRCATLSVRRRRRDLRRRRCRSAAALTWRIVAAAAGLRLRPVALGLRDDSRSSERRRMRPLRPS
jgi:hypothetical protein